MPKVQQATHGFTVGQAVRFDFGGTTWELAQSTGLSIVRGTVASVIDVDTFDVTLEGLVRSPAHGLTIGSVYYIDEAVAGVVVTPQPSTGQEDPILIAVDADNIEVIPTRGGSVVYRRSFDNSDLAANVLTVTHNLNKQYLALEVYDNANLLVPLSTLTGVTATNVNAMAIDFTAIAPLAGGTWNLVVSG